MWLGADDLENQPAYQAAWHDIETQMRGEGASAFDIAAAKQLFRGSLDGILQQANLTPEEALEAAKKFTAVKSTVIGAAQRIQGLINSAKSGITPADAVRQSAALIVGVAVAASAVTAGVGALIIAGVGFVAGLIDGLFGSGPPPGVEVCPGRRCDPAPVFVVNCVCFYDPIVRDPGSTNWRKFPIDSILTGNVAGIPTMHGDERLIDQVFPEYHQLECEAAKGFVVKGTRIQDVGLVKGPMVYAFLAAFYAAWKANKEYTLNGLNAAEDWSVLVSTVQSWNRMHNDKDDHGNVSTFDFASMPKQFAVPSNQCPDEIVPYASMLVEDVKNKSLNASHDAPDGVVRINTGSAKTFPVDHPRLLRLGLIPPMQTSSKSILPTVVVGLGLATAALYGYATYKGTTMGKVLKAPFKK